MNTNEERSYLDEQAEIIGVVKSAKDVRDYRIAEVSKELPDEFKLDMCEVKNQFLASTCAAFAGSEIVEYHHKRQHKEEVVFSTEFIYGLRDEEYYQGEGMSLRDVCNTLFKYGDVQANVLLGNNTYEVAKKNVEEKRTELLELAYPNRISKYIALNTDEEIKTALMEYGCCLASMNCYKKYDMKDNIYRPTTNEKSGRHAVVIYGWNKDGWLIQNSWGKIWGDGGRFIMPYDVKLNEVWGIVDNITETNNIKQPYSTALGKTLAGILNWSINLIDSLKGIIKGWFVKIFKKKKNS